MFQPEGYHPLRQICTGWIGKINRAIKAKEKFQEVADECMNFYSAAAGFMYDPKYKFKFWDDKEGSVSPKFRMTVAKAFELVALFGPVLYHRNPNRQVNPRQPIEIPPELFGDMNLPEVQMMYQQVLMEQNLATVHDKLRAELLSRYLNYTPNELPGGGLQAHAEAAITEALIKGRGVLWSEPYHPPGSDRMLVGSFYDTVDNLLIDPDAETLEDAQWIAKRCVHPTWDVEREYGYPVNYFKDKGQVESGDAQGERAGDDMSDLHRARGETNDLMVYWKIWSKMGIGARLTGVKMELKEALDQQFGDYCYIVVNENVPFPLNLPTDAVLQQQDEDLIAKVEWPIPYWTDDRWPCTLLDFYSKPRDVWPIAPLAPGLGELKFINIMVSHLCNRIWSSSRDFIAILKAAGEDIKNTILEGSDQTIIEIDSALNLEINKIVGFLQQPQTNFDVWKILDAVMTMFDKRVGLTELVYGMSSRQMRSAAEAQNKQEQISIRPDYMANKVETWMTEAARREAFCARWFLTPEDIEPLLGATAASLWGQLVLSQDVNKVVREMEYRVEAGSTRKPNLDRDVANVNQAFPQLVSVLDGHASATGDTNPVNWLIRTWGEKVEMDVSGAMMGPRTPPMPPPMPGAPPPEQAA